LLDPIIVPDHNYLLSCAESQQGAVVQARDATSALTRTGRQTNANACGATDSLGGYELGNLGNAIRAMPPGLGNDSGIHATDGRYRTRALRPALQLVAFLPNISCRSRSK